jgi:hypothetical protein
MNWYLTTVSKVVDSDKFTIEFSIKGFISDCIAYPMDTFDQPEVGDPVAVLQIDPIMGSSFIYKKLRLSDYTKLKLTDSEVGVYKDKIKLQSKDANMLITNENDITITSDKANIKVDKDNNITLTSDAANIVIDKDNNITLTSNEANITIDEDDNIKLESGDANIEITSDGEINIKGDVTISDGSLETKGTVKPTEKGPYCAVPICPFTGLSHIGDKVEDT